MDKRKKMLLMISSVMGVILLGIVIYYVVTGALYVSTEDASVSGDIGHVTALSSGKLADVDMEEGQQVFKDEIVARQETPGTADASLEQTLLRSPMDGVVLKKQGVPGEIFVPGQTLALLVDPSKLYIVANIEETKLARVKVGQPVDVTIDQYGGYKFKGKVSLIGQASNSTFALIPTSGGSTFTKVVQKVPVRIAIDYGHADLMPGTNAVVKIHVR